MENWAIGQFANRASGGFVTTNLTDRALPEELPPWGVLVLESHHSAQFTMEWRTHPFIKVVYVLQGKGTFHLGEAKEYFSAGDVIIVPPGTRNRIDDDPAAASSLYVCCVAKSLVSFDPVLADQLPCQVLRGDGHFANRVASLLRRMVHVQVLESPSRAITMVADAMKMIQAVLDRNQKRTKNEKPTSDERMAIQRYVDRLPSNFFDETSIDVAASGLGIPRRTFTKLFVEVTGDTWLNHIRCLAISHAKRRLRETDLPITSIAFECGFNDLSTFYRQFKKHCGVTPREYRSAADSV